MSMFNRYTLKVICWESHSWSELGRITVPQLLTFSKRVRIVGWACFMTMPLGCLLAHQHHHGTQGKEEIVATGTGYSSSSAASPYLTHVVPYPCSSLGVSDDSKKPTPCSLPHTSVLAVVKTSFQLFQVLKL